MYFPSIYCFHSKTFMNRFALSFSTHYLRVFLSIKFLQMIYTNIHTKINILCHSLNYFFFTLWIFLLHFRRQRTRDTALQHWLKNSATPTMRNVRQSCWNWSTASLCTRKKFKTVFELGTNFLVRRISIAQVHLPPPPLSLSLSLSLSHINGTYLKIFEMINDIWWSMIAYWSNYIDFWISLFLCTIFTQ